MRKATPLLAVVLGVGSPAPAAAEIPRQLATGAPACGNVLDKVDGNKQTVAYQFCINGIDPTAATIGFRLIRKTGQLFGVVDPDPPPPPKTRAEVYLALHHTLERLQIQSPRVLRAGAPACGNVASRAPRRDCIERD